MGVAKKIKQFDSMPFEQVMVMQSLDESFSKYYNSRQSDRYGLHGSNVSHSLESMCFRECVLAIYFRQNVADFSLQTKKVFDTGVLLHERWQTVFKNAGIAVEIEKEHFVKKYDLYFTPDGIVRMFNAKHVAEIKSMNTFQFKKVNTHAKGAGQLMLYQHFLDIPNGFVLMEDKNDHSVKIQYVRYDYEKVKKTIDNLERVQEYKQAFVNKKKVPKRLCKDRNCKRAKYCGLRDACFNVGIGRKWLKNKNVVRPKWSK